ncbi:MAG TPA: hypothetical protein VM123_04600 [archaeon]|nr:hypothetical protein [archaeon]
MKNRNFLTIRKSALSCLFAVILFIPLVSGCGSGKNGGPIEPPSSESWWSNYLDSSGNPITLQSGFKLVPVSGEQRQAIPKTTPAFDLAYLNFAVDANYRSNLGWLFRGHDQADDRKEDLAGAAEFIKQGGWLRVRETFDWDKDTKRYTQPPAIRMTFLGWAGDLMITYLSEPYIGYPTDTTKTWSGKPTYVSDGSGREFVEILTYQISYLGTRSLVEKVGAGSKTLETYNDVILIKGRANEGEGSIDAYLAPNTGIIYYHLVTAFGMLGAGALIGYSGDNQTLSGAGATDYFPTAPGNHWIYEFSPDDHVPEFRFSIQ